MQRGKQLQCNVQAQAIMTLYCDVLIGYQDNIYAARKTAQRNAHAQAYDIILRRFDWIRE